jgi:hypothetical protein
MRRIAVGLVIGSLVLGGIILPAEARGWHRGYYGRHYGRGYFFGGFVAGATTVLVLDALTTPRVVHGPPVVYGPLVGPVVPPPVVYAPVYYRAPVCRDVWVPERWEVHPRYDNGFTTYYQVLVPGAWQRQCF